MGHGVPCPNGVIAARPQKHMQARPSFTLDPRERTQLERLLTPFALTTEAKRAQALLWLDAGHSPQTVSRRLHVSRQTVYNWLTGFRRRHNQPSILARLADKPRSGRPRTIARVIDPLITTIVRRDPFAFGYRASVWNASLLARHLREVHHVTVNRASVTTALRRLGIRLKVWALTPSEREDLERRLTSPTLSHQEKRQAQALLWPDKGMSVRRVATSSHVSRQTVYNWLAQFQARRNVYSIWAPLDASRPSNIATQ